MPRYWQKFIQAEGLAEREAEIPVSADLSGLGACIEWLDHEGFRSEREDLYPGAAAAKLGFVPVGGCSTGTGESYFIREADGERGALCRIYHDQFQEDGTLRQAAVAVVLSDCRLTVTFPEE